MVYKVVDREGRGEKLSLFANFSYYILRNNVMVKKNDYHTDLAQQSWIDAHCHLCSEPLKDNFRTEIARAGESDIRVFISTALNHKEIDWHLSNYSPEIKLIAGIHPYYDKSNLKDLDYLIEQCRNQELWGIGEIGYDKRKNNHNFQRNVLFQQLEIAKEYDLPVVFHVVGRYNELYQTLKRDFPGIRGFIHGFQGSAELVEMFSRLDIGFSLGYKILMKKGFPDTVRSILKKGLVLFETDAPFQKLPGNENSQESYLSNLKILISRISRSCDLHPEDLMDRQWHTYMMMKG
jgi:TatD DNase family protein